MLTSSQFVSIFSVPFNLFFKEYNLCNASALERNHAFKKIVIFTECFAFLIFNLQLIEQFFSISSELQVVNFHILFLMF